MGIGAVMTVGSLALQGFGAMRESKGEAAGLRHRAQQAKNEETAALTRADQQDAGLRRELKDTISSIRAIRASASGAADSPSAVAVMRREEEASDRERRIRVGNERMQAAQSRRDALFFQESARAALKGGRLRALPYFLKAGAAGADAIASAAE